MRALHTASSAEVPPYNRHSKYGVEYGPRARACMHACMHARARGPYSNTTFRSLAMAEVAADFPFSHRSSDQDYPEIAPNDADGLVT